MKTLSRAAIVACSIFAASLLSAEDKKDSDAWKIPDSKENFHVFVLMGQSNMSGYGKVLPEDKEAVPHVVIGRRSEAGITWLPAAQPLQGSRFGLGLPFAKEYLKKHPGITVGLIPGAVGGAPIDRLKKGTGTYSAAINRAKAAQAEGVIKGVLWHQGESDTVTEGLADTYEKKLHDLIADVRRDLGNEDLPFIVGNLAEFYGTGKDHSQPDRVKRIDRVREVLRSLPKTVKNTGFVESTDCSSPDHHMVHFDRKSYIILGARYATIYAQTAQKANKAIDSDKK